MDSPAADLTPPPASPSPTASPSAASAPTPLATGGGWRGLGPDFLAALEALLDAPEGAWWRDVLVHPDVVLAVRRDSLNVYHRGASIVLVERVGERVVARTHAKYLVRQGQSYATLGGADGARFDIDPSAALWQRYEGTATLADMLKAAASLAGPEKIGLHALLRNSPHVVDVEIVLEGACVPVPSAPASAVQASASLTMAASAASASAPPPSSPEAPVASSPAAAPAAGDLPLSQGVQERAEISEAIEAADAAAPLLEADVDEAGHDAKAPPVDATSSVSDGPRAPDPPPAAKARLDRLDVATLEEHDGTIRLVFHEAKHFANKELRAAPSRQPPVLEQMARYAATIAHHCKRLEEEYVAVCRSLVAIDAMRRAACAMNGTAAPRPLDLLIRRVAEGEPLKVDPRPRLVVFGFDDDQKNGASWGQHLARLRTALGPARLYAVGNTKAKTSAAFR